MANPENIHIDFPRIHYTSITYDMDSIEEWIRDKEFALRYHRYETDIEGYGELFCGFRLPPFQRPEVWDTERKIRLMESIFCHVNIGTFVFVSNYKVPEVDGWLIDGQQRLSAIRDFIQGKFGIFDDRLFYENMGEVTLSFDASKNMDNEPFSAASLFRRTWFEFRRIEEADQKLLLQLYERLNFGGVPHTEDQRPRLG